MDLTIHPSSNIPPPLKPPCFERNSGEDLFANGGAPSLYSIDQRTRGKPIFPGATNAATSTWSRSLQLAGFGSKQRAPRLQLACTGEKVHLKVWR
ncbi:hypothetical protein CDAR_89431 [Caerostris darwini]|uniref:Uncharacterized protein n=1 Tax=Caerostris darwini TaxID=1538125 RepID=A0AAV4NCK7_9ARAC|nr:hypothetical protein CDAR_89431 [Caerostris darwini]